LIECILINVLMPYVLYIVQEHVPWSLSGVYNENLSLKSQEIDQS